MGCTLNSCQTTPLPWLKKLWAWHNIKTIFPRYGDSHIKERRSQDRLIFNMCIPILVKLEQLERLRSEIPPAAPWLPILVIHIRSQETRQSQSCEFWKIAKNSNLSILQETLHMTHLLKLLDKMCKYEMDPTRTVGATERTQDAGRTDGQTDGRSETNIPPNNFVVRGV